MVQKLQKSSLHTGNSWNCSEWNAYAISVLTYVAAGFYTIKLVAIFQRGME